MNSKVKYIVEFVKANKLVVPNPVQIKSVMLEQIKSANIKKRYAVVELAASYGHEVLRLPPYHCILNPIEMIWSQVKSYVRKNNATPTLNASVCQLLRDAAARIGPAACASCVRHTMKKEDEFASHDSEERFVIHLGEDEDD